MTAGKLVAIIPTKPLHLAKTRLSGLLTPWQRSALSLGMLRVVVGVVLDSRMCRIWIVGGDSTIRFATSELDAEWHEDRGTDLNDTLRQSFQLAFASGLTPMYLPADLPFLKLGDVQGLASISDQGQKLVLSPAHRDGGTNAIVAPPGSSFLPALGVDSFERHKRRAKDLGLSASVYDSVGLGLDLDAVEDLKAYEKMEPGLLLRLTGEVNLSVRG